MCHRPVPAARAASLRLLVRTPLPGHLRPAHPYPDHHRPVRPCPDHPRAGQAELRRYPVPVVLRHHPVGSELREPSIRHRNRVPQEPQAPPMHPHRHHRRFAVRGQTTTPRSTRLARRRVRRLRTQPRSPGLRWQVPLLRSRPAAPVPSTAWACSPERCRARGSMRRESVGSDRSRSLLVRTASFVSVCHRHCRR